MPKEENITIPSKYLNFITEVIELSKIEGSEACYATDKIITLINKYNISIEELTTNINK